MARARGQPRQSISTPVRTSKIPLNDDSAEKANRVKERTLLQSIQKQKMLAAASPGARRQTLGAEGSPKTPRNIGARDGAIDAVTPLRKVPILANFEEMMKMATDNVGFPLGLLPRWADVGRRKSMPQTHGTLH